jgi:hypothetical protein
MPKDLDELAKPMSELGMAIWDENESMELLQYMLASTETLLEMQKNYLEEGSDPSIKCAAQIEEVIGIRKMQMLLSQ